MRQHFVLVETQELIHAGGYIGHAHLHPVLDDVFDVVEEAGDGALQALDYDCSLLAYRHIQGQHPLKAENCGPALKLPEAPLKIRQRTSAVDESARVGAWHLPLYAMDP